MSDVMTVFLVVFVMEHQRLDPGTDPLALGVVDALSEDEMRDIEADTYTTFEAVLQTIQTNYTWDQIGIHTELKRLEALLQQHLPGVAAHLRAKEIPLVNFAFRWFNCCFSREFPLPCVMRLWDALLGHAAGGGFRGSLPYVALAVLETFQDRLLGLDFSESVLLLQNLPTQSWRGHAASGLILRAESFVP